MDVTQAVRERFDGRAPEYDDSTMHRELAAAVAGFVSLDGVGSVLDAGTGTGLVLRALATRPEAEGVRLAGIDLSPGMLTVARAALPGAELVEGDATVLPFADRSFDVVTCTTALHLFPDADAALAEWVRVLRPGGRVVTATFVGFEPGKHHRHHGGGDGAQPAPVAPYPMHHDRFDSVARMAAFGAAAALRVLRHTTWTDGNDTVLLAELGR
ncbi:class I SAM-dependent methyltransferase [Xylanimonas sp. McL0601]|uniref:class I SAM-dependent methyltransferase n=1 Tax=Xylanimonas sp. McL0601 TaxID=3414739 RepID=UPI003CF09237